MFSIQRMDIVCLTNANLKFHPSIAFAWNNRSDISVLQKVQHAIGIVIYVPFDSLFLENRMILLFLIEHAMIAPNKTIIFNQFTY
jgi:hypothetical protein